MRSILFMVVSVVAVWTVTGLTLADEPRSGQAFGDWLYQCTAITREKTACVLQQTLMSQKTNKLVARFSIQKNESAAESSLVALLPLGLDLKGGVKGKIDDASEFDYELDTCLPRGCIASAKLNGPLLDAMVAGSTFTTVFYKRGVNDPITIPGSLKGIAAGLKAMRAEAMEAE